MGLNLSNFSKTANFTFVKNSDNNEDKIFADC